MKWAKFVVTVKVPDEQDPWDFLSKVISIGYESTNIEEGEIEAGAIPIEKGLE